MLRVGVVQQDTVSRELICYGGDGCVVAENVVAVQIVAEQAVDCGSIILTLEYLIKQSQEDTKKSVKTKKHFYAIRES